MEPVIGRWEWRTFGETFGEADRRFELLKPDSLQESDETYLLVSGTDANVKLRNQLIDIKVLEQIDPKGLEQWSPILKAPFPLTTAVWETMCVALNLELFPVESPITLDRLKAELTQPSRDVRFLDVHKTRQRYRINHCPAELTTVESAGRTLRTVAIESEDPEQVFTAVRDMRLDGFANTHYPRGLKKWIGLRP